MAQLADEFKDRQSECTPIAQIHAHEHYHVVRFSSGTYGCEENGLYAHTHTHGHGELQRSPYAKRDHDDPRHEHEAHNHRHGTAGWVDLLICVWLSKTGEP